MKQPTNVDIGRIDGVSSAPEANVTLLESSRGTIELPIKIYDLIAPDLPRCLQRGDDDRSSIPHFPTLPLRENYEELVKLQTRNTWAIAELLRATGINVNVSQQFDDARCILPCNTTTSLQSPGNSCTKYVGGISNDTKDSLTIYRAGQLVSRDSQSKLDHAAMLCGLFSKAPIVLVVPSEVDVDLIAAGLEQRLSESVHRAYGIHAQPECRVTVATYWAFRSFGLCDAPFVIIPIWKPGYPRWMKMISWGPWRDRIYLLRTVDEPLSERDADDLLGRLGPVLLQPRGMPQSSPIFSIYRFGGPSPVRQHLQRCRGLNPPTNKRKTYWRHRRRNQAIASLARSLAGSDGSIAVLVENAEHAHAVSRLLPDWRMVNKDNTPSDSSVPMIVTLTAAAAWAEFRSGTVVIGLGGPPSLWLLDWLSDMKRHRRCVRIIDLTDGFDDSAARLASARLRAYHEHGCHYRPLGRSVVQSIGRDLRVATEHEVSSRRTRCASR